MCEAISSILTKDYVLFGKTDSHEDIIEQHKLHADGVKGPNIVRIEVTPSNRDYTKPLSEWEYKVDQDTLPKWYDKVICEKRIRSAMEVSGIAVLFADYNAKVAPLVADYEAKRALINADYWANVAPLVADYKAKRALINADYKAKRALLVADCWAKRALIDADYEAKVAPINADYKAKRALINADYEAKRIEISKKKW